MQILPYDRKLACDYAKKWAFKRNPEYYNFDPVGGDCTSFVSQCLYQGSKIMNHKKDTGWYYINGNNKSPSWSGVEFLYRFLTTNTGIGPFGEEVSIHNLQIGDIVQLSFDGLKFAHTVIVVKIEDTNDIDRIYVSSHTYDSFEKPLGSYSFIDIRSIHIKGIRKW